jgi:hypothetical protein
MIQPLYNLFHNLFVKPPKPSTIDRSGIILSDHPNPGNGWIKGWLVVNGKKDTIIVCKHSNPSVFLPNNKVFATSNTAVKHYRTIVAVEKVGIKDYDLDISVCKLDKPFPDDIHAYRFAENLQKGQYTITYDQYGQRSEANLNLKSWACQVAGNKRSKQFISGDSGMPWFVWEKDEWRVASHTYRGQWGIGPWYSHKDLYTTLKMVINSSDGNN